jgi:hypothetical protein
MTEQWRAIDGYEGFYEISNLGRIRSLDRKVKSSAGRTRIAYGKTLSPTDNGHGYLIVPLVQNGKRKNHYVHRLVAEAFIRPMASKEVVNHLDHDTKNNTVQNLEITTQLENVRYSSHRMCHTRNYKIGRSGEKYICQIHKRGRTYYRVAIKQCRVWEIFDTLEEAVKRRGDVINGSEYFKQQKAVLYL